MTPDKRDELYDNLIRSGKVTENEIGSKDDFKNAINDEQSSREFYRNLTDLFTEDEIGSEDDFYGSVVVKAYAGVFDAEAAGAASRHAQSERIEPRHLGEFQRNG